MNRKTKRKSGYRGGLMVMLLLWSATNMEAAVSRSATDPDHTSGPAREISFNREWKFSLGDFPKAGEEQFDDASWRTVDLPHDWSIEGAPKADEPSGNDGGYYPTGTGWYRKTFQFTPDSLRPETNIYFGGIYMGSDIYVNGQKIGGRPYGYISFWTDLTPYLKKGNNTIAIRVDNSKQKNCRWYSGSGIYRNVKLIRTPHVHFTPWGLDVQTTDISTGNDGQKTAKLQIRMTIQNTLNKDTTLTVVAQIGNKSGQYRSVTSTFTVGARSVREFTREMQMDIAESDLWSPANPKLLKVKAFTAPSNQGNGTASEPQKGYDCAETTFGIRTIAFSADEGLILNGEHIRLNGGCLHHDNGCLGAAAWKDAEWRKVKLMKEAGFNAVRTAHNPPSEEFLDACDELGLLVIDEAFDGWRMSKNKHDYAELFDKWWTTDIEAMVKRDRRHPAIFCWSTGNEVIERKSPEAVITANALAGVVRRLDGTRPVTSALAAWDSDWEIYDPLAAAHDIVGYNYMIHKAESDHQRIPERVMMQTESYPRDAFNNWKKVNDLPYVVGDFVWTAIDYLGESGIGRYYYKGEIAGEHYQHPQFPWHGAYCGDIDLTGLRKPISHYRDLLYNNEERIYMAVKEPNGYHGEIKETQWSVWPTWESWNWPGHEGKDIDVEIYSRYPAVRLYLNDSIVGEQPTGRDQAFKAVFRIKYQKGTLRAVGLKNGTEQDAQIIETAGEPYAVKLTADRTEVQPDGESLVFVTAEITDRQGRKVPDADNLIDFKAEGNGSVIATCSADLRDCTPYISNERKAWKGRAMAVIKTEQGKKKFIKLTAKGKGLKTGSVTIRCEK